MLWPTYNSITQEIYAGGLLGVPGQMKLFKIVSKTKNEDRIGPLRALGHSDLCACPKHMSRGRQVSHTYIRYSRCLKAQVYGFTATWGWDKISTCPKSPGPRVTPTTKVAPRPLGYEGHSSFGKGWFLGNPHFRAEIFQTPQPVVPNKWKSRSQEEATAAFSLGPFLFTASGHLTTSSRSSGKTGALKTPIPAGFLKRHYTMGVIHLGHGCHVLRTTSLMVTCQAVRTI